MNRVSLSLVLLSLSAFLAVALAQPVGAVAFPGCVESSPIADCTVRGDTFIGPDFANAVFQYSHFVIMPGITVRVGFSPDRGANGGNITIMARQIDINGVLHADGGQDFGWTLNGGNGGHITLIANNRILLGISGRITSQGAWAAVLGCTSGNGGNGGRVSLRPTGSATVSLNGQINVSGGSTFAVPLWCGASGVNGSVGSNGIVETVPFVPSVRNFSLFASDGVSTWRAEEGVGIRSGKNVTVFINATDEFGDPVTPASSAWAVLNSTVATVTQLNSTQVAITGFKEGETAVTVSINGIAASVPVSVVPGSLDHIAITPPLNTTLTYRQVATIYLKGFDAAGNPVSMSASERSSIQFSVVEGPAMGAVASCLPAGSCAGVNPAVGYAINFQAEKKPGTANVNITAGNQSFNVAFTIYMPTSAVTFVRIVPISPTLVSGAVTAFTLRGVDADGDEAVFPATSWTTANLTGTGTIDSNGTFTAGLPGTVTVTALFNGLLSNSTNVSIVVGQPHHFNVTGPSTAVAGSAVSLKAALQDSANNELSTYNSQIPQVVWSTSSGTIYPNGTLVATTAGNVNVTASLLQNPAVSGTYTVLITPSDVVGLAVAESGSGIQVGSTYALTATLVDKYGNRVADTDATWTILNATGSATLSGRLITPTRIGYVTVYAVSLTNPSLTATGILTITAGQPSSISIAPPSASIRPGNTVHFSVTAFDAFGNSYTYPNATWNVSNTGIATIASDGTLTALSQGSVTVTATAGLVSKSVTLIILESLGQQAQVAAQFATPIATTTVPGQQPRVSINTGSGSGNAGGLSGFFTAGTGSDMILLGALSLLLVGMVVYWATARTAH